MKKVALSTAVKRIREPNLRRSALSTLGVIAILIVGRWLDLSSFLSFCVVVAVILPVAWRERSRQQRLVASRAGLEIDDEMIAREMISNAFMLEHEKLMRVETSAAAYEVAVPNENALHALALEKRAMRMRVVGGLPWSSAISVVMILGMVAMMYAAVFVLRDRFGSFTTVFIGGTFVLAALYNAVMGAEVIVGIDGLAIVRWGRVTFFPWSAVRRVRSVRASVVVDAEGNDLKLNTATGRRGNADARARELASRIERARAAWGNTPDPPRIEELGKGAFRTTHVADETLWEALRSARTPADERVAVARMLRSRVADSDLPKVRIAADACATPVRDRIRAVLEEEPRALAKSKT